MKTASSGPDIGKSYKTQFGNFNRRFDMAT